MLQYKFPIMKIKHITTGLFEKSLWLNLLLMALFVVALGVSVVVGINVYTKHGEEVAVPMLTKMTFSQAEELLDDYGLVVVATDTAWDKRLPANFIMQQSPLPGTKVKSGRVIYVTVNASSVPTITLPDVVDNSSFREAMVKLRILGIKTGEPKYVPGEKDWVVGAECRGKSISVGYKVPIDAIVTLVVGSGALNGTEQFEVTDAQYRYETVEDNSVPEPAPVAQPEEDPFEEVP